MLTCELSYSSALSGLPWWLRQCRVCLQCWRPRSDAWDGKIPWKGEWLPTPVFFSGEFHGQRSLSGLQSMVSQRVGHDWTNTFTHTSPPPLLFCSKQTHYRIFWALCLSKYREWYLKHLGSHHSIFTKSLLEYSWWLCCVSASPNLTQQMKGNVPLPDATALSPSSAITTVLNCCDHPRACLYSY